MNETPKLQTIHVSINVPVCNARRTIAACVESLLAQDLPLAPIYNENGYDWYAGVAYPFASPLDGVTGLYGAPWLAIPVLP